jgi:hypothetical protein
LRLPTTAFKLAAVSGVNIGMGLRSRLFAGDLKLESAAASNPAHILPGSIGEHVARIQQALIALDGAIIEAGELEGKRYGPSTANAVLFYKAKRNIINRSYQTQADNIVGIMTMAALDNEMLQKERQPIVIGDISCLIARQA